MGVSGCGKSSVGTAFSGLTGIAYRDGDDLHSAQNVAKMQSGTPLTDDDRRPWLQSCGTALRDAPDGLILGCSALRRRYRDILRESSGLPDLRFVLLDGSEALLLERVNARKGHYMPASLLRSQLDTLERPGADENAVSVSIDQPVEDIARAVLAAPANGDHA
jgi:gluconokinase